MFVKKNSMVHAGPSTALGLAGKEPKEPRINIEKLKELLEYNPHTGKFTWLKTSKHHNEKFGCEAGVLNRGYIVIQIYGVKFKAHRLAWLFVFGYMPYVIDHINGVTSDNRISNLRNVTQLENCQNHRRTNSDYTNKKSKLPVGVKLLKSGRYQARATANGICFALGSYKTMEEAHERYKEFTRKRHSNPAVY